MHEILRGLGPDALVLDLGARRGSFDPSSNPGRTVRLDIDAPAAAPSVFAVQGDAASLPFRDHCFDAVIANNSLEHFPQLTASLFEVRRTLKPDGELFVSVPDASTISDRIYRFFGSGGGHVNPFRSADEVASIVAGATGLPHRGTRTLFSSLAFLHPANRGRALRLMLLLGAGEGALRWLTWLFRMIDRWIGTRLAVYGWALYFGSRGEPIDPVPWTNVCVRCGAGHSSASLLASDKLHRGALASRYQCPSCGTWNLFTDDGRYVDRRAPKNAGG